MQLLVVFLLFLLLLCCLYFYIIIVGVVINFVFCGVFLEWPNAWLVSVGELEQPGENPIISIKAK